MKAVGGFILGGVAAFAAIHAFNFLAPPIPETKIHTITVEKVVTEEAAPPEIKYQTMPLPNSCETVVDHLDLYLKDATRIETTGEKISDKLSGINLAAVEDPKSVTRYQQFIIDRVETLGQSLVNLMESNTLMETRLDKCRNEINESNNGGDVAPADGLSDVVPY